MCSSHEVLIQQSTCVQGCFKLVSFWPREVPLAFVVKLVWCAEFSELSLVCKAFDSSSEFE